MNDLFARQDDRPAAVNSNSPHVATLWDRYVRLDSGPKLVLRLKSLVFLPTTKAVFLTCLLASGTRAPGGRGWTSRDCNDALANLATSGLITEDGACVTAVAHLVAVDAVASEYCKGFLAAIHKTFAKSDRYYTGSQLDLDVAIRSLRLAIYANDAAGFALYRSLSEKYGPSIAHAFLTSIFATEALSLDWVASRHPVIQVALFEAKVTAFVGAGLVTPGFTELLDHYRARLPEPGFADLRALLLLHDLLAGRLDDLRRDVTPLGDAEPLRVTYEGALAFLGGENDRALERYRLGLKLMRKQQGKRKLFVTGIRGAFFMMALLRTGDPACHAELQAGLDILTSSAETNTIAFFAIQALLWVAQGMETKARAAVATVRQVKTDAPFDQACVALAVYVVDKAQLRLPDLVAQFDRLRDHSGLAARIFAEILADLAKDPKRYRDYLARTGKGIAIEFTGLIAQRQSWERALQSLDMFLGGQEAAVKAPAKAKRLAWFVDPESREVEVAEQAAKGKDGWSDGRPVALKRLHDQDPRLDYLTPQDRAAARSIRRETLGYYREEHYSVEGARTIPLLVGHPLVFHARHRRQSLELVSYPVELVVTEKRDGLHVSLSHQASEPALFLEPETPSRYRVIEFPQKLLALQELLGGKGLTVPAKGRDQLLQLVRRDNPALPIRAEIAELAQEGLAADPTPVLQFTPYEEGIKLSLLVRPFGAEGPAFVGGLGGRSVLATLGAKSVRANRDLAREVALRGELVAGCPTLRSRAGADTHELIVEDLEGSLDLLLEVQAYPGPIQVEWPEGRRIQVSALTPQKMKVRIAKERDWFSVNGTVALDDDQVVEMRYLLDRLDKGRGRFVALEDGRFLALTRQLQTQLQRFAAVSEPHKGGRRVHALGASALSGVLEEAGEVKADAAWKKHVARIEAAEGWTPRLPATLQAELRDYQVEGFVWMSRLARWGAGACLADYMGLGKTLQAIAVLLDRGQEGPSLVVAPTSVCANWVAEIGRFAPTLTAHRFHTATDRAALVAGLGPRDVLVCSYGLLHQAAELLGAKPWQVAVLDEAQAIKNAESKRAQASLSLQAEFRLALTGTPVENYLDELWSLFAFVNPGLLGSREGFQKRFAGPIERDGDADVRQALRALVRPFLLRRTKAAVLSELPPRMEQTIEIEMGEAERAFYEALRQRAMETISGLEAAKGRRKIHILAEITRLRRACCNPALIDAAAGVASGKLERFLDLARELIRNRHRALVFSQFTGHLALVREALDADGISYEYLDGSTPPAERERRVAAFQSGKSDLFLISLRAGGTGLNLTAADYVVHLDPWWNPAVEDQASDRAHRLGQERPVTIYRLVMQDSIEEQILRLHRDKRDLASELLEGGETAARLSEDELLDLIRR